MRIILLFVIASAAMAEEAASRLLSQAQADLAAGRYPAVIEQGSRAVALFHHSGDATGEGRALTGVGLAELYSGNYDRALDRFTRALDIARQTHDVNNEIVRLNNIGNVFYFQGRYADALVQYQEAMRLVTASGNEKWVAARRQLTTANTAILYQTLGQYQRALDLYSELLNAPQALPAGEQAQLLSNVGALRRRLGDPDKALATYRTAQGLYAKTSHPDGEIAVLNNIGIVQAMDLGDYAGAVSTFSEALRLATQIGDRPLTVHAHLYRGEALYRAGKLADSHDDFETAAREATALGEREETWKALYGLGRIAAANGDIRECDALLTRAVNHIEALRAGLMRSSLRSDFLADKRDVYDLLIEHTANVDDLFRWMEQSRARNLRDRVHADAVRTISDVRRTLPQDTVVLEYWMGKSSAAVLWMSQANAGVQRWVVSPEERDLIASLPSVLADPSRVDWRAAAAAVARKFLSDVPPVQWSATRHVVIVPDDLLARIPFEVLPVGGSKLLIERVSVSYLPSASLIASGGRQLPIRYPWQNTLEAFADPTPGGENSAANLTSDRAWPRLPGAIREVNGIAGLLRGSSAIHAGSDARKKYLESGRRAPVLHFATHAFADTQDPDRSYVLLAPASPAQRFDYLFFKEVTDLNLRDVDLVTASACETDAGKAVRGEGVQSFSRAFLAAGAHSVITSLWAVADKSTADLMLRFYARLAAGDSKATALRTAKLGMLERASTSHPAYWAAFVLNGDSATALPYVASWFWFLVPAGMVIFAVVLIRMRAQKGKPYTRSRRSRAPESARLQ